MSEERDFGWSPYFLGVLTGGLAATAGFIVVGLFSQRSLAVVQATQTPQRVASQSMVDMIRARGLNMTSNERYQAGEIKLYYLEAAAGEEGDTDAIVEAALKTSRRDGRPFGECALEIMGMNESRYAHQPWQARAHIDDIRKYDSRR